MEDDLKNLQKENVDLYNEIVAQRSELDELVKGVEAVVADLERAAALMEGDEVQGLNAETRELEGALRDT
jgi:kinetochore protein NNF1